MPTEKNQQIVANLIKRMEEAEAVYLTDYRGLTVPQMQEVRSRLKKLATPSQLLVVKNTLLKLALAKLGLILPADEEIAGPTAVLICDQDEISPLAEAARFGEKFELLSFKGGYLQKEWLPAEKVQKLADLPPLATLQAQATYTLAAPMINLQKVLQASLQQLVVVLKEVQQTKD